MCLSNLRQVGLAALSYAGDYDDVMVTGSGYGGWSANWQLKLDPYMRNKQILQCPSQDRAPEMYGGGTGPLPPAVVYFGYALMWRGGQKGCSINAPTQTALSSDGVHPAVAGPQGADPLRCRGFDDCRTVDPVADDFPHDGGSNVLYWDGHVKWVPWRVLGLYWPKPATVWRLDACCGPLLAPP